MNFNLAFYSVYNFFSRRQNLERKDSLSFSLVFKKNEKKRLIKKKVEIKLSEISTYFRGRIRNKREGFQWEMGVHAPTPSQMPVTAFSLLGVLCHNTSYSIMTRVSQHSTLAVSTCLYLDNILAFKVKNTRLDVLTTYMWFEIEIALHSSVALLRKVFYFVFLRDDKKRQSSWRLENEKVLTNVLSIIR